MRPSTDPTSVNTTASPGTTTTTTTTTNTTNTTRTSTHAPPPLPSGFPVHWSQPQHSGVPSTISAGQGPVSHQAHPLSAGTSSAPGNFPLTSSPPGQLASAHLPRVSAGIDLQPHPYEVPSGPPSQHHQNLPLSLVYHRPSIHQPQHPFASFDPGAYGLTLDQFGAFVPTNPAASTQSAGHQRGAQPQQQQRLHHHWPAALTVNDPALPFPVVTPPPVTQAPAQSPHLHRFPQEDIQARGILPKRRKTRRSSSNSHSTARPTPTPNSDLSASQHQHLYQQEQQQQQQPASYATGSPMLGQVSVTSPPQGPRQAHHSAPGSGTSVTAAARRLSLPVNVVSGSPKASKKRSREDAEKDDQNSPEKQTVQEQSAQRQPAAEQPAQRPRPARGRPRLADEDGQREKRKRQVREAQRAYRSRRDQAIIDLDQKVKQLEETKATMAQDFSDFLQLLQTQTTALANPELSQRFNAISQKYLSSAAHSQEPRETDSQSRTSSTAGPGRDNTTARQHQRRHTMGTVSTASSDRYTVLPSAVHAGASLPGATDSFASSATSFYPPEAVSYEVIAHPTPDNASFPSYTPDPQAPGGWVEQQPPVSQSLVPSGLHPPAAFYPPQERTFGRRLHLTALEQGLRLASMQEPPQERWAAVFGYCLQYEPQPAIVTRLVEQIQAVSRAPMNNWEALFPHPHGYEKRITELPGYEGEVFMDLEAVDGYLLQRGIHIPASAEYVEVEINPNDFAGALETGTVPANGAPSGQGQAASGTRQRASVSATWQAQPSQAQTVAGFATADSVTAMFTDGSATAASDTGSMNPFLCPAVPTRQWTSQSPPKFKATINVGILVEELIHKTVCLGKTPGIRPKDVDRAVKISTGLYRAQ